MNIKPQRPSLEAFRTLQPLEANLENILDDLGPSRGVKLIFTRGHISLVVAFKGPSVTLGLCKCNCSLTRGKELGAAARWKQGARRRKHGGGPDSAHGPCVCHL